MPNYIVEYETKNTYESHVGESYFSFMILPCSTQWQKMTNYNCFNSINKPIHVLRNHYGFEQMIFRSIKSFDSLRMHLKCDVHVSKRNPFDFSPMSMEGEMNILHSAEFFIEHGHCLSQSLYTSLAGAVVPDEWNRQDSESAFDFLVRLTSTIHSAFNFESDITDVHNTAGDAINLGRGVCQDFYCYCA